MSTKSNKFATPVLMATLLFSAMASPAHAYIDPGSGSMIMTTILGVLAAIGYTMRKYFYRIRNVFRHKEVGSDQPGNDKKP